MTDGDSIAAKPLTIIDRILWIAAFVLGLGFAGFVAGFVAPIVLHPAANQGPLLGIFITGPLGAVAGLILGGIAPLFTRKPKQIVAVLAALVLAYGCGVWIFIASTPDPGVRRADR